MRAVIVAIHGINSSNHSSFVDPFKEWCAEKDKNFTVITHEYQAGPFPLWNNWVEDGRIARALFRKILNVKGTRPVYIIAHSNGTVIALRIAKLLADYGVRVSGIIMVAGAIDPEINRNGIMSLMKSGKLGFSYAYCSRNDEVVRGDPRVDKVWFLKLWDWIWGFLMWPYGSLGVTGWLYLHDQFKASDIITRWYQCSHSGYFDGPLRDIVFRQMLADVRYKSSQ